MAEFVDNAGQKWLVKITVLGLEEVLQKTDIDISKLEQDQFKVLQEVLGNPVTLVRVLHVLTGEIMPFREFAERFDGDVIEPAWDAFYQAWVSFCRPQMRAALTDLGEKAKRVSDLTAERITEVVKGLDPSAMVQTVLSKLDTESAG